MSKPTVIFNYAPPWQPIPSRRAAKLLGVSLQSLANWRVRETGPEHEPLGSGKGHKVYYRPDKLAAWLEGGKWWDYTARWLAMWGFPLDPCDEATVSELIAFLDRGNIFPGEMMVSADFPPFVCEPIPGPGPRPH